MSYCIATLLLEGDVFVEQFTEGCETDPRRMALAQRVRVVHDPAITALGSAHRHKVRVEVRLGDGSVETETAAAPRGSESSFASEANVVSKLEKLTRGVLSDSQRDELASSVLSLERLDDASRLPEMLASRVPA
jgi:2-methylcitrate dehydratase PrpD